MSGYLAVLRRVARSVTRRIVRADRLYTVGRHRLKLPWDSRLDVYQAEYKRYDWALGGCTRRLREKWARATNPHGALRAWGKPVDAREPGNCKREAFRVHPGRMPRHTRQVFPFRWKTRCRWGR